MPTPQTPLRARLQLVWATALLAAALAFPAEDASPAAPAVAVAAAAPSKPADSVPAASDVAKLSAIEEDVIKSAEDPSSGVKNNKKRSQTVLAASGNVLVPREEVAETASLSPQIPDPQKKGSAVQGLLLNILQPKPIVDTIREEDKYGNTGDRFAVIGRGVVKGFEGFSNIINKVLDFPFETAKKVSRSATEALNQLGSRLIGL